MRAAALLSAFTLAFLSGSAGAQEPRPATATLEMEPTKLDFDGSREAGMMYMPSGAKLVAERPEGVKAEPKYRAEPKYAVITLGSGDNSRRVIAFDEPEGQEPRIYPDLNGNGDLTDDHSSGEWPTRTQKDEQTAPQYSGTWVFDVAWDLGEGKTSRGQYGLNFYRSPERDSINYYRAGARVGVITIDGEKYDVMLVENDNDARFDKLTRGNGVQVVGDAIPKPVWLSLDGNKHDIRGTFGFGGVNYLAEVSDDGANLSMTPTFKQISPPRPAERPQMLGAGGQAPEFEASLSDGNTFRLADYKGKKAVVVDMWATWCGPCMRGLPHLAKIADSVAGQDVAVVALNVYDEKAAFERFVGKSGEKYQNVVFARDPAGRESDASIAKRLFNVTAIPATYVIDKEGKIVAVISGYTEGSTEIEDALKGLGYTVK